MSNKRITISNANELVRVRPSQLVYITSDGNYSTLVLHDRTEKTFAYNLGYMRNLIDNQLDEDTYTFIRIGRSLIVNIDYVYNINPNRQQIVLSDSTNVSAFKLNASKEALRKLKQYFECQGMVMSDDEVETTNSDNDDRQE